jgi:hypothetical protein
MKESVLRGLLGGNITKLVNSGLQGVYPFPFASGPFKTGGPYTIQSPVVLSQLAMSPSVQVLSYLIMETDAMLRTSKQMFPKEPREEALKLAVSANAEVLNFVASRISWLLAKLEGVNSAELSPPRVTSCAGQNAQRVRAEEGIFLEFWTKEQALSFRFVTSVQSLLPAPAK